MEEKIPYSYTMDYESKEIVMTTYIDGEKIQLRVSEKTAGRMISWFDLARAMKW